MGNGKTIGKNRDRGKRIRDKEHCEEIKTGEHVEPREQAIKRLKSLTNAKEILLVRVLDKLGRYVVSNSLRKT